MKEKHLSANEWTNDLFWRDTLETDVLSVLIMGVIAAKVLSLFSRYGRRSTTISLRESKTASVWRRKNTAPLWLVGEDIVYANVKSLEVC